MSQYLKAKRAKKAKKTLKRTALREKTTQFRASSWPVTNVWTVRQTYIIARAR